RVGPRSNVQGPRSVGNRFDRSGSGRIGLRSELAASKVRAAQVLHQAGDHSTGLDCLFSDIGMSFLTEVSLVERHGEMTADFSARALRLRQELKKLLVSAALEAL